MNLSQLARSALYSQAVADAVGNPFEFGNFPASKVDELLRSDDPLHITDDTQMAMFGMEALILSAPSKFQDVREQLKAAYLRWLVTQCRKYPEPSDKGLLTEPTMYRVEAPGTTCLTALEALKRGVPVNNDSKGCGCVMRLLPFVLLSQKLPTSVVQSIAIFSGRVTHRHSEVVESCSLYVTVARDLLSSGQFNTSAYRNAKEITAFGDGWTAMSCVEMALWALTHATTFEELLHLSICHSGDSDSVAAVAGSLWGLTNATGYEPYASRVEQSPAIDRLLARWDASGVDQIWS
jgi:ADP-ribosylglycohydrolase